MVKKHIVLLFGFFLILSLLFSPTNEPKKYNVILISIDTVRVDHLGLYGYVRDTTPVLDRFSKDSIIFKNVFVQFPKTSQSVASMLVGKYPEQVGVLTLRTKLPEENLLISEILTINNITSAGFVSNGNLGAGFNFNQGFTEYYELWRGQDNGGRLDSYIAEDISNVALPWISNNTDKQFFLWLHYIDPHAPYTPPGNFSKKFLGDPYWGDEKIVPRNHLTKHAILKGEDNISVPYYISQYDAELSYIDSELGKLFQYLRDIGELENSIIIITSDHGESFDEIRPYFNHGYDVKNYNVKVPLIIYHPELKPMMISQNVQLMDIAPTILDMLGIPTNQYSFEGASLIPIIRGKKLNRQIFIRNSDQRAIIDGDYKLIKYNDNQTELYDLLTDPSETTAIDDKVNSRGLEKKLDGWTTRMNQYKFESEKVKISQETENQFRELGYM